MSMLRTILACKKVMIAMLFLVTGMLFISNDRISARAVYSFEDEAIASKAPNLSNLSGSHLVWTESDADGYLQVFYQNVKTSDKKQITTFPSQKHSPRVGETKDGKVFIIWTDAREYDSTHSWVMYGYELSTGLDWKLSAHSEYYFSLNMNGSEFVGQDNATNDIYHYNLITNIETFISKGRIPAVAEGKVLYKHVSEGGLSLTNVNTGVTRVVLDLPYHLYVWELVFDGTTAFYKQSDLDLKTKYVLLDTSDPAPAPVDLTSATKKSAEYYQMYISNGKVAWVQDTGGTPVLNGYQVANKESFQITVGDQALRVASLNGQEFIMKQADGSLFYKSIIRTEVPDFISSGGAAPQLGDESASKKVNAQGGELLVKDGSISLSIPPGALSQETDIEIKLNKDTTEVLNMTKTGFMKPASRAWQVSVGAELHHRAQLTFSYDSTKFSELQMMKMVIYRWNESTHVWDAVSTQLKDGATGITANIVDSGTYALFVNDVMFADGLDHWARTSIEVLASRGIVDGLSVNEFVPDGLLTRAQFTKMLVGALQLNTVDRPSATFKDVSSSHWSHKWIEAAVSAGLVQGDGDKFNPDAELTREQMMIMLVRAMGNEQQALVMDEEAIEEGLAYSDSTDISSWARKYAALASKSGLIEGDNGVIHPKESSTRAQAVTVVYRLLHKK
jgi:hypothetical protein